MEIANYILIDFNRNRQIEVPTIQCDMNSRFVRVGLRHTNSPINLSGVRACIMAVKPDGKEIFNDCEILDAENGLVQFEITEQMGITVGDVECQIKLFGKDKLLSSNIFNLSVTRTLAPNGQESKDQLNTIVQLLGDVQEINNRFEQTDRKIDENYEKINTKLSENEEASANKFVAIDSQFNQTNQKIDENYEKINTKLLENEESNANKFVAIDNRFNQTNQKIDENYEEINTKLSTKAPKSDIDNIKQQVNNLSNNRLYGKKIVAIGDSMVKGHTLNENQVWLAKIAERNNMTYVNYGINGGFLSGKTGLVDGSEGVCDRYTGMDDDADYVVVFAGTNDATAQVTLGNESSTSKTEFYGALIQLCEGLLTKYPTKRILFITPYRKHSNFKPYLEAIETVCGSYGIPVFNNEKRSGISWLIQAQKDAFTLGDDTHLNELGHEYVSYRYEEELRRL